MIILNRGTRPYVCVSLWSVRGVNLTHICFWSWLHILPVRVHQCSALQDAKMQIRFETKRQMFYSPIHPHRIKATWRQICNTVDLAYLLPCPTKIYWNRRQCEELWKWREASKSTEWMLIDVVCDWLAMSADIQKTYITYNPCFQSDVRCSLRPLWLINYCFVECFCF